MVTDEGETEDLSRRPLDEAVDVVLDRDESRDRATVRTTLERVAADGWVTDRSVQDALAHAAKVVSTPETRVEVAETAITSASETAEPVDDLDVVRHRLETLEDRLGAIEERVDELGAELRRLVRRADEPESLYAVAAGVGRLTEEANDAQRAADELATDAEEFEHWVQTPAVRYDRLAEDAAGVEDAVADLEVTVDSLTTAAESSETATAVADTEARTLAPDWLAATFRQRLLELIVADLESECRSLRDWAERTGDDEGSRRLDEIEARLDAVDERRGDCSRRLESITDRAWIDRYGDRLADFEAELDESTPPVDWGALWNIFERSLPDAAGGS